jgi:hypothetical protein
MNIDKELYQQSYRHYQTWNQSEAIERARNAGKLSPLESWRRYIDLVEFCWRLQSRPSEAQRHEKLAAAQRYYVRVQQLEAWRNSRGKAS